MGVSHLWTILEPVRKQQSLADLSGMMLAVDLSMWIMESKCTQHLANAVQKPYLRNLFFRISTLYKLGVKLVFVTDGKPPEVKSITIKRRLQSTSKKDDAVNSTKVGPIKRSRFQVMVNECLQLLDSLGVPYVRAEGEAEALCAFLNLKGIVNGCITDDGDAFLYGATRVYRNFTMNSKDPHVDSYCMQDVEDKLKLNRLNLIGLAILLGCDYFPKGVPGVGPVSAVAFMQKLFTERVNVLERFDEWVKRRSEILPSVNKPTHCSHCQHVGSKREHTQSGCRMCGSLKMCLANDERDSCVCEWHSAETERLEVTIRSKAIKTDGFPGHSAIKEFLITKDHLPKTDFVWQQPSLSEFMRVAGGKMNWPDEYSAEKIVPLITRWQMLRTEHSSLFLKPNRIVKTRVKQQVPSLEVEWHKPDILCIPGEYVVTIEPLDLFCKAFEELYINFQTELDKKKKPKSKKPAKNVTNDQYPTCLGDITNNTGLHSWSSLKIKVVNDDNSGNTSAHKDATVLKTCSNKQYTTINREEVQNSESISTFDVSATLTGRFKTCAFDSQPTQCETKQINKANTSVESSPKNDVLKITNKQTHLEEDVLSLIVDSDNEASPLPLALRIKMNRVTNKCEPTPGLQTNHLKSVASPSLCTPTNVVTVGRDESVIVINSDAEESLCQKPTFVECVPCFVSTPASQLAVHNSENVDISVLCIGGKNFTLNDGFHDQFSSLSISELSPVTAACHASFNQMENKSENLSKDLFGTPL